MTQPYEHLANLDANGKDFVVGFDYEKVVAFAYAYADATAISFFGSDNEEKDFDYDVDKACGSSVGLRMTGDVILNNAPDVLAGFGIGKAAAIAFAKAVADAYTIGGDFTFNSPDESVDAQAKAIAIAKAYAKLDVTGLKGDTYTAYMGHGPDTVMGVAKVSDIELAVAKASADAFAKALLRSDYSEAEADAFAAAIGNPDAAEATAWAEANAEDVDALIRLREQAESVATAFAKAYADADTKAIGIDGGIYDLDSAPDKVLACAEGADKNMGVRDVVIYGGKGNDEFHLQSGTGDIFGGYGGSLLGKNGYGTQDFLGLEGSKSDYTFTAIGPPGAVNIVNTNNCTNMNVYDVELFGFGGDTYNFADLFV